MACDPRFLTPGRSTGLVLAVAALCLSSVSALAGDGMYVRPDGSRLRLMKSDSEFGVTFQTCDPNQIGACARRLAATGGGVVSDLPWAPEARLKLVRVAETSAQRRDRVSAEPEIEQVMPVYRFEGLASPLVSTGSLMVRLRGNLPAADRAALFAAHDVVEVEPFEGLSRTYRVRPVQGVDDELRCGESLADDPRVTWCQPDLIGEVQKHQAGGVQDDFFSDQWHLRTIDAPDAWPLSAGLGVIVGMFDDSLDTTHPDLRNGYLGTGHDPTKATNSADFNDPRPEVIGDRHGTACMGLIVAQANDIGVRGVSYLSRFTASRGLGGFLSDAAIASVYTFARQQNVDVHNNSWGANRPNPQIIVDAIDTAFREGRDLDGAGGAGARGMVVLFATGNDNAENTLGSDLSSIEQVIGVGASNIEDRRTSYSNFGKFINLLAPSGDDFLDMMVTTDNEDAAGYAERGYNVAGFDDFGFPELDKDGNYSQGFSGTSAACPVATGIAALIISANPQLTASDVRLVMEHTCEQVSPQEAQYDPITSRSDTYGYGRVNALAAVNAAIASKTNGNLTWPERISNPRIVSNTQLRWDQNIGTNEFLIVQADSPFGFIPVDGACYSAAQVGCGFQTIQPLPAGVSILFVGCGTGEEGCGTARTHKVDFLIPAGKRYFGIFARSNIGRYSYGVAGDSDGNFRDDGPVIEEPIDTDPGSGGGGAPTNRVAVTIMATPRAGSSPLTVAFNGNAVSDIPIDDSQTAWDFDLTDSVLFDTRDRNTSHMYIVPTGQTRRFRARLTMVDMEGNEGSSEVEIFVDGGGSAPPTGGGAADLKILVGTSGNPTADVSEGTSPFNVVLNLDASSITGTLQSVFWDLGDGQSATSLAVPHTYFNTSGVVQRVAVSATVTTRTAGGTTISSVVSKLITVNSGSGVNPGDNGGPCEIPGSCADNGGGVAACGASGGTCGAVGLLMPLMGLMGLRGMRRRGSRRQ